VTRSHVPTFPPSPDLVTTRQLRCLHALARQRGLDHDDLRRVCGVPSLKELGRSAAARAIDRLQDDRPDPPRHPYRRGRRKFEDGEVRAETDATNRQRCEIIRLFDVLDWPLTKRERWLRQRHGVDYADLAHGIHTREHPRLNLSQGYIDRREASLAIRELGKAADKLPPSSVPTSPPPRVPTQAQEEIPF
jgi:hypothetical protein